MTLEKTNQHPRAVSLSFDEQLQVTSAILTVGYDIAEDGRVLSHIEEDVDLLKTLSDEEIQFFTGVLTSIVTGERPVVIFTQPEPEPEPPAPEPAPEESSSG